MADPCSSDAIVAQLERILKSPRLESSPSLSQLLRYVVVETLAGRGASLKEYSLGSAVFERGEAFDPRLDPIVRVQARNLRARLAEYYAGTGANDPIFIDLPKRTYVPVFYPREEMAGLAALAGEEPEAALAVPPVAIEPIPVAAGAIVRRSRWAPLVAAALLLVLFATAAWLVWPRVVRTSEHQPDSLALDLYIRARQLIDHMTETDLRAAADTLQEAVQHDPKFAAAHATLAETYNILAQFGYMPPAEGMKTARRAAETALALNPHLADGHVALAAILEAYDWNWKAAEREYRRALELNPSMPAAHLWYGMFLRDQGRLEQALPELRRAAQLDPYSVFTSVNLAYGLLLEGSYPAAAQEAQHAARMAPSHVTAHVLLANAYRAQSLHVQADAAMARAMEAAGNDPHGLAVLARACAARGREAETRAIYTRLETLSRSRYVSPYDLGTVSLMLGEETRALAQLQEAYRQRSSGLIFLRKVRFAKSIRDPQFWSLIEKMGISS